MPQPPTTVTMVVAAKFHPRNAGKVMSGASLVFVAQQNAHVRARSATSVATAMTSAAVIRGIVARGEAGGRGKSVKMMAGVPPMQTQTGARRTQDLVFGVTDRVRPTGRITAHMWAVPICPAMGGPAVMSGLAQRRAGRLLMAGAWLLTPTGYVTVVVQSTLPGGSNVFSAYAVCTMSTVPRTSHLHLTQMFASCVSLPRHGSLLSRATS